MPHVNGSSATSFGRSQWTAKLSDQRAVAELLADKRASRFDGSATVEQDAESTLAARVTRLARSRDSLDKSTALM